jgi:hypothetical protein
MIFDATQLYGLEYSIICCLKLLISSVLVMTLAINVVVCKHVVTDENEFFCFTN